MLPFFFLPLVAPNRFKAAETFAKGQSWLRRLARILLPVGNSRSVRPQKKIFLRTYRRFAGATGMIETIRGADRVAGMKAQLVTPKLA